MPRLWEGNRRSGVPVVVYPAMDSAAIEREMSTLPMPFVGMAPLFYDLGSLFRRSPILKVYYFH